MARLAARQHGVVSRVQLLDAGLTAKVIRTRRERGTLVPLHRGVYAVGHRHLRREGVWLAAVLAVGPEAALSHRDAAALHGLRATDRARIDVTTPRRNRRGGAGIDLHLAHLHRDDVTRVHGVPVTTVARTIVDLAGLLGKDHLARVLDEAEGRGVLDVAAIATARRRVLHRHGPGHAVLAAVLAAHAAHGATVTRSTLERLFLALAEDAGLPRPAMNAWLDGREVDAVWHAARVAVELDSLRHHRTRAAFQRDREKGNELALAGWTVLRFTYRDVTDRPGRVATQLRAALAAVVASG